MQKKKECVMEDTRMKKYEMMIQEEVGKIVSLVLEINAETDYAAFFEISGHIEKLSVSVRLSKSDYNTEIYSKSFIALAPCNYDDEEGDEKREYIESDYKCMLSDIKEVAVILRAIKNGNIAEMIRIKNIDAHSYSDVYAKGDDGEYFQIIVDAAGDSVVYDVQGKKYTEVYIKTVGKGAIDGIKS